MTLRLNPYLGFTGTAREAMETYAKIFGGELSISTFGEFGQADGPHADQVMHSQLDTDTGLTLMASDAPPGMEPDTGSAITVSLTGDNSESEKLHRYWEQLAEGGTITMPLEKQMWGDEFGMLTDRFGVPWMINIGQPEG